MRSSHFLPLVRSVHILSMVQIFERPCLRRCQTTHTRSVHGTRNNFCSYFVSTWGSVCKNTAIFPKEETQPCINLEQSDDILRAVNVPEPNCSCLSRVSIVRPSFVLASRRHQSARNELHHYGGVYHERNITIDIQH